MIDPSGLAARAALMLTLFCGIFMLLSAVCERMPGGMRFAAGTMDLHDANMRQNRLKKYLKEADNILALRAAYCSNERGSASGKLKTEHLLTVSVIFFGVGAALGVLLKNGAAALILALFMSMLPIVWLRITKYRVYRSMDEQLEQVLGIITGSYLQNEDIIRAVAENLPRIEQPLHTIFAEFVTETSLTDASVTEALLNMKRKNSNSSFGEWCDILVQCQNDRELKYVLTTIAEELNDNKKMMIEADTVMRIMWRDYFIMLIIAASQIPMIRAMNREWYRILTETAGGRAVAAVMLLICGVTAFWVSGINSMDYKYGESGA